MFSIFIESTMPYTTIMTYQLIYEILVRNAYPYSRIHKYVFREVGNLVWEDNHVLGRILSQFGQKKI